MMIGEGNLNFQLVLLIVVGFLAGMIPAMLLIGFLGGRQVEKQRKELKLHYERQVTTLRATIRRLMQRIEQLTGERNQLSETNSELRKSLDEQAHDSENANSDQLHNRAELEQLQDEVDRLTAENLRHQGRLEESRLQRENMTSQFQQTVAQFTEAERLRRHLLFATNQLREAQVSNKALESRLGGRGSASKNGDQNGFTSPAQLELTAIESIEAEYIERLHDSGIHTVADLARQTPARVAHFAGLPNWDESAAWIAEAKDLMANAR